MSTINPFYRFEDAIEVPSMGEGAKRVSAILSSIYGPLQNTYVGFPLILIKNDINNLLTLYNDAFDVNIIAETMVFPTPTSYPSNYQMWVYEPNLIVVYPSLRISLVFEVDSLGIITAYKVTFMGQLTYSISSSPALYYGEIAAYHALVEYNNIGSAIFPKYYKFDPTTGIATSSVARFKDCKFDSQLGMAVRSTADIAPRSNRTIIQQDALDGDGKYIIAIFDKWIQFSQQPGIDWSMMVTEPDSWIIPDGYVMDYYFNYTGQNRIQYNIYKPGGKGYTIILREQNGFTFQRFYAPQYSAVNLLNFYSVSTNLPYETTALNNKYQGVFYDFDLCEFADCPYPKKEGYAMPIKTGDELKFNVHPYKANVMTKTSVDVGIFDSNFNFVQKVGNAIMRTKMSWKMTEYYTYPNVPGAQSQVPQTLFITTPGSSDILTADYSYFADLPGNNLQIQTIDILNAWITNVSIGTICFQPINDPLYAYEVTWELPDIYSTGYLIGATGYTDLSPFPFINTIYQTISDSIYQFQSDALIPSVAPGCYRLGLYNFDSGYDGLQTTWNVSSVGPLLNATTNYVFAILNQNNNPIFMWSIPIGISTFADLKNWVKDNTPFAKYEEFGPNSFTLSICPYKDLTNYTLQFGTYDYATNIVNIIQCDENAGFDCGDVSVNEVYAFSNILNLDNSDCFSTIIQYWSESNSIAEGFEYYDGWYQQVRLGINGGGEKPKITESIYRQSNGVFKRPQSKQDLSLDLHTDFIDLETQLALVDATRHEQFVWNGRNIFVNGDIEVATIQDFSTQSSFEDLAQVKFSALVQGFQPKNSTCINC